MAKKMDKNVGGSGEEPILSDEDWADFERSFTKESTKTAAYKEPSARQRELTEKWKKEQPKDTGWRTDGPKAELSSKPGGGSGAYNAAPARKHRRPWVRNLTWVLVATLATTAIIGGPKLFSSKKSNDVRSNVPTDTGSPTGATTASSQGSAHFSVAPLDPSRAAIVDKPWPAIDLKTALPGTILVNGASYQRINTATSLTCTESMSQALGDLVASGPGCQQLVAGLYTDPAHKMQFTVSVLSMKRAEDAGAVFAALKADGLDYQVVELDPPPGSGVPTVPPGSPGYTDSAMTVRSVVVVGGQYSDGADHGKDAVARPADLLLSAVSKDVADYEQSRAK